MAAIMFDLFYNTLLFFTHIQDWFKKHYDQVYLGQVIRIRRFDIAQKAVAVLYDVSWLQHLVHVARYCTTSKSAYKPPSPPPNMPLAPTSSDYFYYEYAFGNGTKTLLRTQGAAGPTPAPGPPASRRSDAFLYVGMGNKDYVCTVTEFVNQYDARATFTIDNRMTAKDLFIITVLDDTIYIPQGLRAFDPIVELDFLLYEEVVEKHRFVGDEVVAFY